jgi:hypothetical protein
MSEKTAVVRLTSLAAALAAMVAEMVVLWSVLPK